MSGISSTPEFTLDELQHDALTELINIGVSRAAKNLAQMTGHELVLSVPSVTVTTREEAAQALRAGGDLRLVAVNQDFVGDVSGRALLIFPETNSLELVSAVIGGDPPLEDIIALESEALAETGNVILNGCLATISNMLRRTFDVSLPSILRGSSLDLFELHGAGGAGQIVLFLHINFSLRQKNISGHIALLLQLPALAALKRLLDEMIERI